MSIRPFSCPKCHKACLFLGANSLPDQSSGIQYGVAWGCASCDYKGSGRLSSWSFGSQGRHLLELRKGLFRAGTGFGLFGLRYDPRRGERPSRSERVPARSDGRGLGFIRSRPVSHALALLNQALQKKPNLENAWLMKCTFLEGLRLNEQAVEMLEGALAVGGPSAFRINMASALHRMGRFEEAATAARTYLEAEPQGRWAAAARTNLGLALRQLGNEEAAEDQYRQAIELESNQVLHYRNLA